MRRIFTTLTAAAAVLAFSSMVMAQAPAAPAEKAAKPAVEKTTAQTPAAPAEKAPKAEKKMAAKATTATGKIAKYDDATKTLTVTTKKGDENFTLTETTKVMEGAKAVTPADLTAGKNVKVAYSEANGTMTATKVTIAGEKAAKAKKDEMKKEEPKKEEKK